MRSSILFAAAAAAPFVAGLKTSTHGGAKVVNQCGYKIPLQDVPAMADGIENAKISTTTLMPKGDSGNSYSAPFVQLLTAGGWSIKLNTIDSWTNIMQFEYTWADDNQLWYDLSFVDGKESEHPAWEFQCPDCPSPPHKGAYQHSTDDSNGMQKPAPPDVTITLVLCPGGDSGSGSGSSGSSASSAAPAPSSEAPAPTTTPAPQPSTTLQTYASTTSEIKLKQANVADAPATTSQAPAPSPVESVDPDVVVVYETKVVTAVVTETAHARKRRHEHRHPHGHSF